MDSLNNSLTSTLLMVKMRSLYTSEDPWVPIVGTIELSAWLGSIYYSLTVAKAFLDESDIWLTYILEIADFEITNRTNMLIDLHKPDIREGSLGTLDEVFPRKSLNTMSFARWLDYRTYTSLTLSLASHMIYIGASACLRGVVLCCRVWGLIDFRWWLIEERIF